ncbi:MAG TPA: FMN-binding protein [Acidimicrobiales bacterium]|jgi:uncharacterized protein with FMN-binding domain
MKRAPIVLSATAASLAGVLAFHSGRPHSSLVIHPPATTTPATPATTAPPAAGPTAPTQPTAVAATRVATGAVSQYPYGELSVTVTETGGRITNLQMASLNETDSRSVRIDDEAIPQLQQEVLSAQNANIDGVSGATFTSQAYAQSVQSALDKLDRK